LKSKKLPVNLKLEIGGTVMNPGQWQNTRSRMLALKEGMRDDHACHRWLVVPNRTRGTIAAIVI
jgi:hypothetical protein